MKVFVAMSGGVDSSTTAAILKEEGYDVVGVTMQIWPRESLAREADQFGGCCGLSAIEDARRVAQILDIPHYVFNLREAFEREVISDFVQKYSQGQTPNPCLVCNKIIKFEIFLRKALTLGADFIATGHYARIEKYNNTQNLKSRNNRDFSTPGQYLLRKGIDLRKDQSYFLWTLTQEQMPYILMPLGYLTKEQVRKKARELGLPVAEKEESQEICFIPDNNYRRFLKEYLLDRQRVTSIFALPGPILDTRGKVLGHHQGILNYTIGQRRGLGISSERPLYVLKINARDNSIIVGRREEIYRRELLADEVNWISGKAPTKALKVMARIRYNMKESAAVVTPLSDERVKVEFDQPQWAITPGQSVVFYVNDRVIGGGVIISSI